MGSIGLVILALNALTCIFAIVLAYDASLNSPYNIILTSCVILIGSVMSAGVVWAWSIGATTTAVHRAKAPLYAQIRELTKELKSKDVDSPAEEVEYDRLWD